MSNYTKATNFAVKDGLTTGDPSKRIKGTEIDTEYNAIASAISSKADSNSPTFTGTPLAPTASSTTNNTQIATTAFVANAITASLPAGVILLWSGSVASVPSGWYLCNGSNGTPDLRNRFVVGAGSTYAVGATGGSADAITVSHTHTFSATTGTGGNDGTIALSGGSGARPIATTTGGFSNTTTSENTWGSSSGTYTVAGTISYDADHTHTVSGTTASTGSSGTNANLPPYYALCYIMKA